MLVVEPGPSISDCATSARFFLFSSDNGGKWMGGETEHIPDKEIGSGKRKEAVRDKVPSKAKPGPRLLSGMLFPLKWQRNQGKISTSVCVCLRI